MKKILFLTCLFLFLLNGAFLCAQTLTLNLSSMRTDSNCQFVYRLTAIATGGTQPYIFELDSIFTNMIGIFENVNGGNHTVTVRDMAGRKTYGYINLETLPNSFTAVFQGGEVGCDSTQTRPIFYLNVQGGQPPYRFFIGTDTVGTEVNSFQLLENTLYNVRIKDANNCIFNTVLRTPKSNTRNFLNVLPFFTPRQCGDSIGTLKVRLRSNMRFTTPLSMSFDNRLFSSDSIFTNIASKRTYQVRVKTQNCGEQTTTFTVRKPDSLSIYLSLFTLTNCSQRAGQLNVYGFGGTLPYSFSLNGQAERTVDSSFFIWENIGVATTNTIRIRSAEGCEVEKNNIIAKYQTPILYNYSVPCGQTGQLFVSSTLPQVRFKLDNQNPSQEFISSAYWQNIASGHHTLQIIDSVGCILADTLTLYGSGGIRVQAIPANGTCVDSIYKLKVSGGVPPYTYSFQYGAPTMVNNFTFRAKTYIYFEVTDANFCRFSSNVYGGIRDTVRFYPSMWIPNCSNNTLSFSFAVSDTNAARPLSISFDGRPFSSDTFITNVTGGRSYSIIVKSKQGCDLYAIVDVPPMPPKLSLLLSDSCALSTGFGSLRAYPVGGVPNFRYAWNTGVKTPLLSNVPTGRYSVTITDELNCQVTGSANVVSCVLSDDTETIKASQVNVYPNPTTGIVHIDAQNIIIQRVSVLDITGKVIQRVDKSEVAIPNSGTYFLKIETNRGVLMKKIVKIF